jgi:hypothetical protein
MLRVAQYHTIHLQNGFNLTCHQPVTDGFAIGTRVIRADRVFSNDNRNLPQEGSRDFSAVRYTNWTRLLIPSFR